MARRVPFVAQLQSEECGPACLTMILGAHGCHVPLTDIRDACGVGRAGVTAWDLVQVGKAYGLEAEGSKGVEPGEVSEALAGGPAILGWVPNHFVVAEKANRWGMTILDPALGRRWVPLREAHAYFTGIVLSFRPTAALQKRPRLPWAGARVAREVLSDRATLAVLVIAALAAQALTMGSTLSLRVVLDLQGQGVSLMGLALLSGLALAAGVGAGLEYFKTRLFLTLAVAQEGAGFGRFLRRLVNLPVSWHQARGSADLLQRVNLGQESGTSLTRLMLDGMTGLGMALGAGALLGLLSPLALLAAGVASAVGIRVLAGRARRVQAELRPQMMALGRAQHLATEFVASAEWLELSGLRGWARARAFASIRSWIVAVGNGAAGLGLFDVEQGILSVCVLLSVLGVLSWSVGIGALGAGQLGVAVMATTMLVDALTGLGMSLNQFEGLAPALERLDDVINAPERTPGTHVAEVRGVLEVKGLGFRYWGSGPAVLEQVDLKVSAGEMVGLVGPSGSGKSTLGHLLAGLRSPSQGLVMLDGIPLQDWEEELVRASVVVVLQRPEIFRGTVRFNLLLGALISDQDCWQALRLAQLEKRVIDLGGLDGQVDAQGGNLSGGERQRLALARALLLRPRVLILDEATSALDLPTEAAVMQGLRGLSMTRIVITHRRASLASADRILTLDAGRVRV